MYDIKLDTSGDIEFRDGDILLVDSVIQAVTIKLKWFFNEWRFGPDYGIDYYGEYFVKDPDLDLIEGEMRSQIEEVDGVDNVEYIKIEADKTNRLLKVQIKIVSAGEYKEGRIMINV